MVHRSYGEFDMHVEQASVAKLAELDFAFGKVGQRHPLGSPEAEQEHAYQLSVHTLPLTQANTAGCGDDRPAIGLADGTNDPLVLRERIVSQLFGGLGLATTKALVSADAVIVKDAKSMWEAYEIVSPFLYKEFGEEDAGHAVCGASGSVEKSVAHEIPRESLVAGIGLFVPFSADYDHDAYIQRNTNTKRARLESGFYSGWDPAKHQDYLISRFPQNFSFLADDPDDHETRGHNGSSIYVVTSENRGFATNAFNENTGQQAFSVTQAKMHQLAYKLGGSPEERLRILIGFADDALHVGAGIVTKGMPVFKEEA